MAKEPMKNRESEFIQSDASTSSSSPLSSAKFTGIATASPTNTSYLSASKDRNMFTSSSGSEGDGYTSTEEAAVKAIETVLSSNGGVPTEWFVDQISNLSQKVGTSQYGPVIALESIIATGKSRLSSAINVYLKSSGRTCKIYAEQLNMKMLKSFYADPNRTAMLFQTSMLCKRIVQWTRARLDKKHKTKPARSVYLWDRSMVGDLIFSLTNHLLGKISVDDFDTYMSEFFMSNSKTAISTTYQNLRAAPYFKSVDMIAYLTDEPAECQRRKNERNTDGEEAIPLKYFEQLDDIHFQVIIFDIAMREATKVAVFRFQQFCDDNVSSFYRSACDISAGRVVLPYVRYGDPETDPEAKLSSTIIYHTDGEIAKAYSNVIVKTNKKQIPTTPIGTIYIPLKACVVSPESRGFVQNNIGFTYHTNQYKRLVTWYLSIGYNVKFY